MRREAATKLIGGLWKLFLTVGALALFAVPAGAGEIYSWQSEDGSFAYTDDKKAIPARYRKRVTTRNTRSLDGYQRYTPQDEAATDVYTARLASRVERLRELNQELELREQHRPRRRDGAGAPDYVTIRTGRRQGGVDLTVPATRAAGQDPLTVETVFVRLEGSNVIQRVQVTKRGGQIVSVTKPRPRNWDVNEVIDESELLEALGR